MSKSSSPPKQDPSHVIRAGDRRSLSRSAVRALDILEFFGEARRPLRAIEIARRFDLHPSTVNQLLKSMVDSAHLTFEADTKSYLPSPRLSRFCSWMVENHRHDESLRRMVAHVQANAKEVVTLTTPNGAFMQVIDLARLDFLPDSGDGAERGLRVPMFGSVVGAAYLSGLPMTEVRRLAQRADVAAAEQGRLVSWLARIRADGYAEGGHAESDTWSVAVPLTGVYFGAPLVLGLAGPAQRVQAQVPALSALLTASALDLGRKTIGDGPSC